MLLRAKKYTDDELRR